MNLTELGWKPFFADHFEEFAKQGYALQDLPTLHCKFLSKYCG